MPSPQIQNPAGAFGLSTMSTYDGNDLPAVVNNMLAATTISRGDLVALGSTVGQVIKCLTDTGQQLLAGVSLADTAAGGVVPVVTSGPVLFCKKGTSSITAGDLVTRSATVTAGAISLAGTTAITQLKDTGLTVGIATATVSAAATSVSIFVVKL